MSLKVEPETFFDQNLLDLAKRIGARIPFWVQGAGGNISSKVQLSTGAALWIKASGWRLDQMSQDRGFACVDLSKFNLQFRLLAAKGETEYSQLLQDSRLESLSSLKPSMETGFHALLPNKYVFHFHSLAALEMTSISKRAITAGVFSKFGLRYKIIELCQPGLELTREIAKELDCDIYLLDSHGVVLQAESPEIMNLWEQIETTFLTQSQSLLLNLNNSATQTTLDTILDTIFSGQKQIHFQWQCLFPDAAVFSQKILQEYPDLCLDRTRCEALLSSRHSPFESRNLLEIILANLLLQKCVPQLPILSKDYCSTITGLPTEIFRQGVV